MKSRFSSVDIKVIVKELQRFRGLRVVNIYDTDNKTYLIKLSKPEEKVMILIESGIRIHSTEFQWPKNVFPSGFSMKMRKHLKGRRLEKLTQLGIDRIVDFQFGSNEAAYHVIVELYDRGNIILADYEYLILNILRPRTDESQEVRFAVREKYPIDVIKQHEPFSPEKIKTAIELAKDGDSLKKVLVPLLEYGPAITEHCILQAGFELNFKFGKNFNFSEEDFQRLFAVFTEAEELLSSLGAKTKAGYIIQKLESRPNTKDGEPKELLTYDEFHPLLLLQHEKKTHQKFDSFDKAVDEYFSKQEAQKLDVKVLQQERLALKKLENVKKDHEKRVQLLQKEQDLDTVKGQLIEMNLTLVDQAIMVVQSALANQIDWTEIANLVKQAQSEGDPVASTIKKLKLDTNHITLLLKNPYGDEEMDQTETVDIDLSLTAYGNSKKYFDKKKQAAKKEKKTIDASKKALRSAERKTKQTLKDVATSATINKTRKTYWFEKFLWFISSENYLVIGGRDQQQNELIVKRHLRPGDVYVHADLHGASSVIIKNSTSFDETSLLKEIACGLSAKEIHSLADTLGFPNAEFVRIENQYPQDLLTKLSEILKWKNLRETQSTVKLLVESLQEIGRFDLAELLKQKSAVPPKTLNEAGTMAICNSVAWDAKVVTSAWWVYHDQVSKTAPTGEYLTTGSFMIRGKKNYLPPSYLIYGFGFLFKLEDGSVFRHAGERRVREIKDHVSPTIGESLDPADEDTSLDEVDEDEAAENSSTDVSEEENRDEQIPDDSSISESGNCASTCANSSDSKDDASSQRSDVQDDSIFPDTAINLTFVGDKLQLQRAMSSSNTEEQVTAEDGASSQATDDKVLRKSAKLSAKQKREMKKKKRDQPVQNSLDDSCSSHPRDNSKQHDQANEGSENKASQQQKYQKRGQKTKLKKIREKYKDQDEEERQLRMKILGSIGSAKEEKRKGKKRKDATMVSKQGSKTGGPTKPVQPGGQQVKAEGKPDSMPALLLDNPMNDAESKPGSDMKSEIEDADDDNLDEAEDGMQPAKDYQILDTLTSCPVPDDELLYAVPMMAPYNTLINYKFKVKLLPGSTKRGKAAKTSMNIFIHDKSASSREKDLIRLLKDVDISRNIPGKVKLAASNLPKKKQK